MLPKLFTDIVLCDQAGWDLSSISFFQRGTAQDFITFTSKILVERTGVGARQSVKEAEYMCHVFVRGDRLSVVCVSDHEYPPRVAHTMMQRVSEDFAGACCAIFYSLFLINLTLRSDKANRVEHGSGGGGVQRAA